jgi:DNA-binding PadR family transcriptional regulator
MNDYQELSFDCVLPSAIFFNSNLEPACIKFYAIIRNLTKKHGYCYATNEYLEGILGCSTASIKRWLGSLEEEGYLEVETEKNGINWQRRIYLSDKFKIELRRLKNEPPPAQKCTPPSSKMSPIIEEYSKEREIKEEVRPPASHSQARGYSQLLLEAIKKTKPDIKPPNLGSWEKEIDRMLRLDKRSEESLKAILQWLPKAPMGSNGFCWANNILSAEALRTQFDKLELAMKQNRSEGPSNDLGLIQKLKAREDLISAGKVIVGANYVEFPQIRDAHFKAGEPAFFEKVLNTLRKIGVAVNSQPA